MKNKINKMLILTTSLVFLGTLMGCRENPEKSIVGEWLDPKDYQDVSEDNYGVIPDSDFGFYEFTKDGKIIIWHEDSPNEKVRIGTGSYEFIEADTIKTNLLGEESIGKISFIENGLILTDIDDGVELVRLLRIK